MTLIIIPKPSIGLLHVGSSLRTVESVEIPDRDSMKHLRETSNPGSLVLVVTDAIV